MALNLDKLIGAYRFVWNSKTLGKILVHNLSVSANLTLNTAHGSYIDADSIEFVRSLIAIVCQLDLDDSGKYTDSRVSTEQANTLTGDELNEFSRMFLEKNSYLKNDQAKSKTKKRKNQDGKLVTTIEYEKRNDVEKAEGESDCDLLKRLMHYYRLHEEEQTKKLFESLKPKNIFSNSVLDLIGENQRISDKLGVTLRNYEPTRLIELPENPIFETNRQLEVLGREFRETSILVKNMNDLGLQMAVDMASSSQISQRHNTIMIIIGLVTLIFSAVMSYLSYVSSDETTRSTQELLLKVNADQNAAPASSIKNGESAYLRLGEIRDSLSIISKQQNASDKDLEQLALEINKLSEILKSPRRSD
ncbi:hypothetical protein [Methylobacter sp.]|uniref:hypothetical protein n=1 Tax=Methylobacter sp. TaxID=2051955 RepID=UPI002FDEC21E